MMSGDGFGALAVLVKVLGVACLCMLPLAVWKLIEIGRWLFAHVHVSWW